jgi:flagellum-specific ATP synthase
VTPSTSTSGWATGRGGGRGRRPRHPCARARRHHRHRPRRPRPPRSGPLTSPVGDALLGRIVDALGRPIDGGPPIDAPHVSVDADAPHALARRRIDQPLDTGVRLIDTLCTVGRGQRLGLFAGSGVGKSTLLAMMVRGTTRTGR